MKKIYLSGKRGEGKFTLVDNQDYEYLNQWKWHLTTNGYARSHEKLTGKEIFMHRLIMKIKTDRSSIQIDHININKLDNRRSNLRIVTPAQNRKNRALQKNNTSGYKGIYWAGYANSWRVILSLAYKQISLGYYKKISDAIKIRDAGIKKYYGEYGRLA